MSAECTCAEDWRAIPKDRRIILEAPGAMTIEGRKRIIDRSKVHVYDRDCQLHGYTDVTEGSKEITE
jgi:hypothetical protein